jgi:hypothetical protein
MAEHECTGNTCQTCSDEYDADNAAEALGHLVFVPRRVDDQQILAALTKHIRNVVRQELQAREKTGA